MNRPVTFLAPAALAQRLTRRSVLGGLAAAGFGLVAAGCAPNKTVAPNTPPDGELESKLNLYSWGDYDDPALIEAFGDEFDVVVQVDAYGSNEELIAKLSASRGTSGYDVVVPTDLMIPQMVEHNLLQKWDKSLLPNFSNMDPSFMGRPFDPHNEYSMCKAWGTTGFVYDTTVITRDMTSWQDFYDAANDEASGKMSVLEDPWELCAIGLAMQGSDLNSTDEGELEQMRKTVLDGLAPNIRAYVGNAATAMSQGSFALIHAFNGDARQGLVDSDDPDRWKFVFPTPTANLWMDNWCLASGAQHPDAAHAFVNHMISEESALTNVDYIGYPVGTNNLRDPAVQENFDFPELIFPEQKILDRLINSQYNEGYQFRVDVFSDAQARSGA